MEMAADRSQSREVNCLRARTTTQRLTGDRLVDMYLDGFGSPRGKLTWFLAGERLGLTISTSEELSPEGESSSMTTTRGTSLRRRDRRLGLLEEGVDVGLGYAGTRVRRGKHWGSGVGGRTIWAPSSIARISCRCSISSTCELLLAIGSVNSDSTRPTPFKALKM
jgi:hypothetical protein